MSAIKDDLTAGDLEEKARQKTLFDALAAIPNLPADDVPPGKDENDNVQIRSHGEAR